VRAGESFAGVSEHARDAIAVSAVSNTRTGEVVFEALLTYNDP
jgi:hypothetical protein